MITIYTKMSAEEKNIASIAMKIVVKKSSGVMHRQSNTFISHFEKGDCNTFWASPVPEVNSHAD